MKGQKQLDNTYFPFLCRPTQSSLILVTLGIDIEVMNKGLHLCKITRFGSCMKCIIARHSWLFQNQSMTPNRVGWKEWPNTNRENQATPQAKRNKYPWISSSTLQLNWTLSARRAPIKKRPPPVWGAGCCCCWWGGFLARFPCSFFFLSHRFLTKFFYNILFWGSYRLSSVNWYVLN